MKLEVTKIDNQGDRVLIYGHPEWQDYYVIAPTNTAVKVGDTIEYTAGGHNFGWFVRVIPA